MFIEHFVFGIGIELLQQALGLRGRFCVTMDAKHAATVGNFHTHAQLDQAQMRVERAAQIGQAFQVVGGEGEVGVLIHGAKGNAMAGMG